MGDGAIHPFQRFDVGAVDLPENACYATHNRMNLSD